MISLLFTVFLLYDPCFAASIEGIQNALSPVRPIRPGLFYLNNKNEPVIVLGTSDTVVPTGKPITPECEYLKDLVTSDFMAVLKLQCGVDTYLLIVRAMEQSPSTSFTLLRSALTVPISSNALHTAEAPVVMYANTTHLVFILLPEPPSNNLIPLSTSALMTPFIAAASALVGGIDGMFPQASWSALFAVAVDKPANVCVKVFLLSLPNYDLSKAPPVNPVESTSACVDDALLGLGTVKDITVVPYVTLNFKPCVLDETRDVADVIVSVNGVNPVMCGTDPCAGGMRHTTTPKTSDTTKFTNALVMFRVRCQLQQAAPYVTTVFIGLVEDHHGFGSIPNVAELPTLSLSSARFATTVPRLLGHGNGAVVAAVTVSQAFPQLPSMLVFYFLSPHGRLIWVANIDLSNAYSTVDVTSAKAAGVTDTNVIISVHVGGGPSTSPATAETMGIDPLEVLGLDTHASIVFGDTGRLRRQRGPVAAGTRCAAIVDLDACNIDIIRWGSQLSGEGLPAAPYYAEALPLAVCRLGGSQTAVVSIDSNTACTTVAVLFENGSESTYGFLQKIGASEASHSKRLFRGVPGSNTVPRSPPSNAPLPPAATTTSRVALLRGTPTPCAMIGLPHLPVKVADTVHHPVYLIATTISNSLDPSANPVTFGLVMHACVSDATITIEGFYLPPYREEFFGFSVAAAITKVLVQPNSPSPDPEAIAFAVSGSRTVFLGHHATGDSLKQIVPIHPHWPLGAWQQSYPPVVALGTDTLLVGHSDEGSCACGRMLRPAPLLQCDGSGAVARYNYYFVSAMIVTTQSFKVYYNLSHVLKHPCGDPFTATAASIVGGSLGASRYGGALAISRGTVDTVGSRNRFMVASIAHPGPDPPAPAKLLVEASQAVANLPVYDQAPAPLGVAYIVTVGSAGAALAKTINGIAWPSPLNAADLRPAQATYVAVCDDSETGIVVSGGRIIVSSVQDPFAASRVLQDGWTDMLADTAPLTNVVQVGSSLVASRTFATTIAVGAYGRFAVSSAGAATLRNEPADSGVLIYTTVEGGGWHEAMLVLPPAKASMCSPATACGASLALAGPYIIIGAPMWRGSCVRPQGIAIVAFVGYPTQAAIPSDVPSNIPEDFITPRVAQLVMTDTVELRDSTACDALITSGPGAANQAVKGLSDSTFGWYVDAVLGSKPATVTALVATVSSLALFIFKDVATGNGARVSNIPSEAPPPVVVLLADSSSWSLPPDPVITSVALLKTHQGSNYHLVGATRNRVMRAERAVTTQNSATPNIVLTVGSRIRAGSTAAVACAKGSPSLFFGRGQGDTLAFSPFKDTADNGARAMAVSAEYSVVAWLTGRERCALEKEVERSTPELRVHTTSATNTNTNIRPTTYDLSVVGNTSELAIEGAAFGLTVGRSGWFALSTTMCGGPSAGGSVARLGARLPNPPRGQFPGPGGNPGATRLRQINHLPVESLPNTSLSCSGHGAHLVDVAGVGGMEVIVTAVTAKAASGLPPHWTRMAPTHGSLGTTGADMDDDDDDASTSLTAVPSGVPRAPSGTPGPPTHAPVALVGSPTPAAATATPAPPPAATPAAAPTAAPAEGEPALAPAVPQSAPQGHGPPGGPSGAGPAAPTAGGGDGSAPATTTATPQAPRGGSVGYATPSPVVAVTTSAAPAPAPTTPSQPTVTPVATPGAAPVVSPTRTPTVPPAGHPPPPTPAAAAPRTRTASAPPAVVRAPPPPRTPWSQQRRGSPWTAPRRPPSRR